MNILRQIGMILAKGQLTTPVQATDVRQRWRDVPPKLALSIADGKYEAGAALVNTTPQTIALPAGYTAGQCLYCAFSIGGTGTIKVTVVSPDHGTSVYLLQGSNDAVNGFHTRPLVWCGTVTSITCVAGTASAVPIDWTMFELPDLTLAASYRIGQLALGVSA